MRGQEIRRLDVDVELAVRSAATGNDAIAERIREFTVGFVYNLRSVPPTGAESSRAWSPTPSADPGRPNGAWRRGGCGSCGARDCRPWSTRRWNSPLSPARPSARSTRTPSSRFGVDAYGNVVGWDFKQSPHFLIAGATSTGKTSLLMTVGDPVRAARFQRGVDRPERVRLPRYAGLAERVAGDRRHRRRRAWSDTPLRCGSSPTP